MGILWIAQHSTLLTMHKLMIASLLAVAAGLPIDDTAEVAAAKAEFQAAFDAATAGAHAALAPVNNDLQADQIASAYLADSEDVAAAKAEFQAAFESAAAGGLAAKQAPAPVHALPAPLVAPAPATILSAGVPYGVSALNALPALNTFSGYPYAAAGLPYGAVGFSGYPYAGLPVIAAAKTA